MSQGSFLESLKTYLHRLTADGPAASPEAEALVIDPAWSRRLLLRTLNRVEMGESKLKASDAHELLDAWQTNDRILVFVRELARLLRQGMASDATTAGVLMLIEAGLARILGVPAGLQTRVLERELDRLVQDAHQLAWRSSFSASPSRTSHAMRLTTSSRCVRTAGCV